MSGRLQAHETSREWEMGGQENKAGPEEWGLVPSAHIYT